jgi:hypothetical protein
MFEPKGMILNKATNLFFFAWTHGAPTLVDFYTYVELNKDTIIKCPHGSDDMWVIADVVRIYFYQGIF